jgi:hypothetical protein
LVKALALHGPNHLDSIRWMTTISGDLLNTVTRDGDVISVLTEAETIQRQLLAALRAVHGGKLSQDVSWYSSKR